LRTRRKILISVGVVVAIAVVVAVAFFTGIIVIPRATKLSIHPSSFTVESGSSIMLTARLESDSFILSGKTITWSVSEGSLDKTVGETVTYTAPIVTENTSITITASFAGDRNYLGSSASTTGLVTPRKATPTTLAITPPTFEVTSGGTVTLTAMLTPSSAPSEMITWSLDGPGTLSSTAGASVTYTAPEEVAEKITVKVTATFPGTTEYSSNTATCTGVISPPVAGRKATTLTISPTSFTLKPSETIEFTATLKDVDGNILTDKTITWSLDGPGTLSSTAGASVTYTAPEEVAEKITVTLTATFPGDEDYLGSSVASIGEITPVKPEVAEEYVMTFSKALLKNARIEGPTTIGGIDTAKVTVDAVEIMGFNLSRIGLTASTVSMSSLEIYATNLIAYSPELGKTLEISGGETVSLGPYDEITFEEATIRMVRMSAKTGELKEIEVVGEYVGGAEPYIPTIIYTPQVEISEGYAITGRQTYGKLINAAVKFEMGKAVISDVSLVHPIEYSLNRGNNTFTSLSKWVARASKATMTNLLSYDIYATFYAVIYRFTFTGEDDTQMPHGSDVGYGGTVVDASIHLVYVKMDTMVVEDFVVEIL